jgi:L-ascorbate metabolism protein UlaG (beta-lactamase superfamily)
MSFTYTWYGHGTHGLKTAGYDVLIDPYFTDNPAASTTADKVNPDFIVVSHGHGDHIGDAVNIAQRTGALVISNFEIVNWLSGKGLEKLHPQHIGGGVQLLRQGSHHARPDVPKNLGVIPQVLGPLAALVKAAVIRGQQGAVQLPPSPGVHAADSST